MDQRFSLLPMPFTMGSILALALIFTDGSILYREHFISARGALDLASQHHLLRTAQLSSIRVSLCWASNAS